LAVYGLDSTTLRVADTPENVAHCGRPPSRHGEGGGYPQLRLATLLTLRARLLAAAACGPYRTSEVEGRGDERVARGMELPWPNRRRAESAVPVLLDEAFFVDRSPGRGREHEVVGGDVQGLGHVLKHGDHLRAHGDRALALLRLRWIEERPRRVPAAALTASRRRRIIRTDQIRTQRPRVIVEGVRLRRRRLAAAGRDRLARGAVPQPMACRLDVCRKNVEQPATSGLMLDGRDVSLRASKPPGRKGYRDALPLLRSSQTTPSQEV
jgi:hypothetical protein